MFLRKYQVIMLYFKMTTKGLYVKVPEITVISGPNPAVYALITKSVAVFRFSDGKTAYIKNRDNTNYQYTDEEKSVISLSAINIADYTRDTI